MQRKKCTNPAREKCGMVWNETTPEFADGFCTCGCPLVPEDMVLPEPDDPPRETTTDRPPVDPDPDALGDRRPDEREPIGAEPEWMTPRSEANASIAVFADHRERFTMALEWDEVVLGRRGRGKEPDLDLSDYDPDGRLSRRHLLLLRREGRYFARNLSRTKSVYVNDGFLTPEQERVLADGDRIVLGGLVGIEFRQPGGPRP